MNIPSLSTLVPVDVKHVWPMEASSFTPWLLANADVLGGVLGMDLHLEVAEHKVGGFSLDLLGRDQDTDEIVIVENQFGATDHRHLGQLLTYAGGTTPATVVWIAESFRDEHRAALDWLNARTDGETRFFGVQLGAVTLTGAPTGLVAPLLEVVVKPNDWGKQVKKTVSESEISARRLLYREFWMEWLTQVSSRHWTTRKAPARHWMHLPSGSSRARYSVSFRTDGLMSELFFNHPDPEVNQSRWKALKDKQNLLEASYGAALVFDDLPSKKGCRIAVQRTGGEKVQSTENWNDYKEWFEVTQTALRKAIFDVGGVPPLPLGAEDNESDDDEDA